MNNEQFINQEVININNESGIVISFDDDYVVVKYNNTEKTYSRDIVFSNKYLAFKEQSLNQMIQEDLLLKEKTKKQQEEQFSKNRETIIDRRNRINNIYKKLLHKNEIMKLLFGNDFLYPPYVEYIKKYKHYINITL